MTLWQNSVCVCGFVALNSSSSGKRTRGGMSSLAYDLDLRTRGPVKKQTSGSCSQTDAAANEMHMTNGCL